jgi:hypothetical protein
MLDSLLLILAYKINLLAISILLNRPVYRVIFILNRLTIDLLFLMVIVTIEEHIRLGFSS